jgi:hypothetical protein
MKRQHNEIDPATVEAPTPKRARPPPEVVRGDRPIYRFFLIWKDAKGNTREVPARCLLDWGSTTFAISKCFVTAFGMPTIERDAALESYDASGRRFEDDGKTRTYPLRFSFGNHCSDEVFEVMTMGDGMEVIVPYWWMQKHRASGVYDGTLRFNDCPSTCFHSLSPGWSITYDRDLVNLPQNEVFTAGAVTAASAPRSHDPTHATASGSDAAPIAISAITAGSIPLRELLPEQYHKYLLLFAPEQSEKLPEHRPYDHAINLTPGTEPKWGPVYRLSREEFEALKEYIAKMIKEGKIRPSSSPAGSPVLFVPKPGGRGLRLCVDYRDLNKITIKDRTPLPIMDQLAEQVAGADWFTKLDLKAGYNLIRIRKGDEWKTAFRSPLGHYEYLVMPFGLCNAPATFQRMMNDIMRPFLGNGVVSYLDDILIHSKGTVEEHRELVGRVLQTLINNGLAAEIAKCEFERKEVEFLGYIVSGTGVRMSAGRSQVIQDWKAPKSQKDVQVFIGFCNFYRRFIQGFSAIAKPITDTLKGDGRQFAWGPAQEAAFLKLKILFHEDNTPIMRHYEPDLPAIVETDSSDFALGAVLSQRHDNRLHPVAFLSKKLSPAELNYEIYDKEMLAIVRAFQEWRHYLQGAKNATTVYTDHKNLEYFTTTKVLNRRQARWAELLSTYDFQIVYRKGSSNGKPDALSRRPELRPKEGGTTAADTTAPLLKPEQYIEIAGYEQAGASDAGIHRDFGRIVLASIEKVKFGAAFLEKVREAAANDEEYTTMKTKCGQPDDTISPGYELVDGLLYFKHRLVVPSSLRDTVLKAEHDSKVAGHWGAGKTVEIVGRNFHWPNMDDQIRQYVHQCDSCQRNKPSRHRRNGLLHPLELPNAPWTSISMDFVTDLPESENCTTIWVVVDRFTKMAHFIPLKEKTATYVARQFVTHIWKAHGLPDDIVSDRDTAFTSKFWKEVMAFLGVQQRMSTAFHPQTDGQTERVNQVLEAYLREYCNYEQNDWAELLPLAEYAYNNSFSTATGLSPFYANYGFNPRTNWPTAEQPRNPGSELYAHWLQAVHEQAKTRLEATRDRMAKYWDQNKREGPSFAVGDYVMLNGRHIKTKRASKKLDAKLHGPFRINRIGRNGRSASLDLPPRWRIHPTFHITLLEPYRGDPNRAPPPVDIDADGEGWTPEAIVAAGPDDDDPRHHKFLVKWVGYGHDENTWETYAHMIDIGPDLVQRYYDEHPHIAPDARMQRPRPRRGRRS